MQILTAVTTYKILGSDGRQYGPVTTEQVIQWIQENRAYAYTKICVEGTVDWRLLSDFPEFAAALKAQSTASGTTAGTPGTLKTPPGNATSASAPSASQLKADAIAAEILSRDYSVDIGRCVSRAWDLVMARFWLCVGACLLVTVVGWALAVVPGVGHLLFNYVLWTGFNWMLLKMVRGQPAEVNDVFAGFSKCLLPLMLFSLIAQLLTFLGLVLCILPGIYLAVIWLVFPGMLIIDKGLDFWPAMELSRKVVNHHFWQVFGLLLVCAVLMIVGTLLCLIGTFITTPIAIAAIVFAYEDIFGGTGVATTITMPVQPVSPQPTQPPPS